MSKIVHELVHQKSIIMLIAFTIISTRSSYQDHLQEVMVKSNSHIASITCRREEIRIISKVTKDQALT